MVVGKFMKLSVLGWGEMERRVDGLSLTLFKEEGLKMALGFGKEYKRHKPPFPTSSCDGIKRVEEGREEDILGLLKLGWAWWSRALSRRWTFM